MNSESNPDRRRFLKTAGVLAGGAYLATSQNTPAQQPTGSGKNQKLSPIIAVHGGYTSHLPEHPEDLQAAKDTLALITTQAEDYLFGRGDDGQTHDAVETARFAVELLEASRIFNAGIGARFQRDGDIRRTAAIMARSAQGMPVSGSIEVVPGVLNPIAIAHSRFLEARSQPRHAQTGYSNVHLSGETSLEYLLAAGTPIPGLKTGYQATAKRLDEILAFTRGGGQQGVSRALRHAGTGTVGCVVMDVEGHFAAATSTGGTANNVPGRVGDVGTAGGTFASQRGAASMTGDGEGIRNLAMACGMVNALDFISLDQAAIWMFRQAHEKHVSAATIFIGRGKGDDQVQLRCTDSDAALTFAYSLGNGHVEVFTADPAQYFTFDEALAAAKLGKEYYGFAKSIGTQRTSFGVPNRPDYRKSLEQSVERIKNRPENLPVSFLPPQPVKGIEHAAGAIDMRAELAKASGASADAQPEER